MLDIRQAESVIRNARNANPNIAVIITIDGQAGWQQVVSFVELAQDLKIDSFSFAMKKGGI
jgi:biopolymer transport protein ExbD